MKQSKGETNKGGDEVSRMLAEFDAIGMGAKEFSDFAGLPAKFIDNARAGKYRSDRASSAQYRRKFRAALDRIKLEGVPPKKGPGKPQDRSGPAEGSEALERLQAAIRAADSPDECIDLQKLMDEQATSGILEVALHRALNDSIKERRQLLELRAKQQEQARAGEPIVVEIRYVASWRPAPKDEGEEGAVA